ncbi:MAG: hypothetical protein GX799_01820 [Crenarchaeota archaeon]|nr:hypothetical protein [Thermoproteota archaeon]
MVFWVGVGLGLRGWCRRWCWFGWFGFYDVGAMRSVVVGVESLKEYKQVLGLTRSINGYGVLEDIKQWRSRVLV